MCSSQSSSACTRRWTRLRSHVATGPEMGYSASTSSCTSIAYSTPSKMAVPAWLSDSHHRNGLYTNIAVAAALSISGASLRMRTAHVSAGTSMLRNTCTAGRAWEHGLEAAAGQWGR